MTLPEQVETLIQETLQNTGVGIILLEADTGKVIYERRSKELFTPASTTKLFTSAAALLDLGRDYQFETSVQADLKQLQGEVLEGDLHFYFSGDPSFTTVDFHDLILKIKTSGIHHVNGNLIIDDSHFQSPFYAPGWSWDTLSWYYATPITAIVLDQNQISIQITSNKTLGGKAEVVFLSADQLPVGSVQSELISVSEQDAELRCSIEVMMDFQNKLSIKGCWPYQETPNVLKVALKSPYLRMQQSLREGLTKVGITFSGKIIQGKTPETLKTIALHHSGLLYKMLEHVLQDSNNLYTALARSNKNSSSIEVIFSFKSDP